MRSLHMALVVATVLSWTDVARGETGALQPADIEERLESQSFPSAVTRCVGEPIPAGFSVVVQIAGDGVVYLLDWAPATLPDMAANCLASEVMKLSMPSTGATTVCEITLPGEAAPAVRIVKVSGPDEAEDAMSRGRELILKGLVLSVLGDVFLTVAVALLPRMLMEIQDPGCTSTGPCGPDERVWLAFDVLGAAAGLVLSIVGATQMQIGFALRNAAQGDTARGGPGGLKIFW